MLQVLEWLVHSFYGDYSNDTSGCAHKPPGPPKKITDKLTLNNRWLLEITAYLAVHKKCTIKVSLLNKNHAPTCLLKGELFSGDYTIQSDDFFKIKNHLIVWSGKINCYNTRGLTDLEWGHF